MDQKYLKYSLEELLEDRHFIAWILKGKNREEWMLFVDEHPEIAKNVEKAREVLSIISDFDDLLSEDDMLSLWHNIFDFNQQHEIKVRRINLRRTISIAASIFLIISLGTFAVYFSTNIKSYNFSTSEILKNQNEARIILSNGEQFLLEKDKSTISLYNENELVINNEIAVDLSDKLLDEKEAVRMNEVVVPFGKRSELLLADGTQVWLNAGSRLAFPAEFTGKTREVFLEGEACFKVAKNEVLPFIVNARKLDITVLGTYFNVAAYPGDENIETVLVEGSVSVTRKTKLGIAKNEVILKPFQKATFNNDEKEILVSNEPDADVYVAWTENWLQFSKQTLQDVFTKLERYYNVEIVLPKSFPSEEKISGKLDLKYSLEQVMQVLADVAKIEYRIEDKQIFINKNYK